MKFFSLALTFLSLNAFACPNLGGNYTCGAADETWDMSIVQTQQNGVTVYKRSGGRNEGTFIADGKTRPHTVSANEEEIRGTLSTTCSGSKVTTQFLADYHGSPIDFTEKMNYSNGGLVILDTVKLGGQVYDNSSYECKLHN